MPCTETIEHAYVYDGEFRSMSWLKDAPKTMTDAQKVQHINSTLSGKVCQHCITGRVSKGLVEIYLEDVLLVPQNKLCITVKHLFIQRWVPQTKTFDLVVITNEYEPVTISAVPKSEMGTIQQWHKGDIYCGGADPLPIKAIARELKKGLTYDDICNELECSDEEEDDEWLPPC